MNCLGMIRRKYEELSPKEKLIADFVLENASVISMWTINDFSQSIGVSNALLVKFTKKLGYKGFSHFKHDLAKVSDDESQDYVDFVQQADSLATLIGKVQKANTKTFSMTYELLDTNVVQEVVQVLLLAKKIVILGIGGSAAVAVDFYHKLVRLGLNAHYHTDTHLLLTETIYADEHTVFVAISYSGETVEIVEPCKLAKENNAKIVSISQQQKSSLNKMADYQLNVISDEKELRFGSISSRFSMLAVCDILTICIARHDLTNTLNNMEKIKQNIEVPKGQIK